MPHTEGVNGMKLWKRAVTLGAACVLALTALPVSGAAQTVSASPLTVSITADKSSYATTDFAKISVSVANKGAVTVEDVTVNNIVPPGLRAYSKTAMNFLAGDMTPGAQMTLAYQVCLAPDRGDITSGQRFAINFKSFFKRWTLPYADFSGPAGGFYIMNDSTTIKVSFGGRSETLTTTVFYGQAGRLTGSVADCLSGAPLAGAAVTAYQTASPGGSTGLKVFSATGGDGTYCLALPAGTYNLTFSVAGHVAAIHYSLTVAVGATKNIPTINLVPGTASTPGQAGGKITNISGGAAISGATVRFRYGINRTGGSYYLDGGGNVIQRTTDAAGNYSATLPCGNYTAEVVKTGFATLYYSIYSAAEETGRFNQDAAMTSS